MSNHNLLDAMLSQAKQTKKQTDKQQKIVETAIKLFAEKGYANTSTSEISKAAGVAEGTIFRHFGTKERLLLALILPFLKDFIPTMAGDVFKEIMSKNIVGFDGFLRALLKNRMEFFKENKDIFQILVKELFYKEELRNEFQPYFEKNIFQRITQVIDMYKERGELREDISTDAVRRLLFTFVGGYFVTHFLLVPDNSSLDEDDEIENIIKFVMDGIGVKK